MRTLSMMEAVSLGTAGTLKKESYKSILARHMRIVEGGNRVRKVPRMTFDMIRQLGIPVAKK